MMAYILRNERRVTRSVTTMRAVRYCFFVVLLQLVPAGRLQCQAAASGPAQTAAQTEVPKVDKPESAQSASDAKESDDAGKKASAVPEASSEDVQRKQMIADTEKLYQLAAELRAEVAKTYKETLSLEVVKKAKDVEAMAKSLKVSMGHAEMVSKK